MRGHLLSLMLAFAGTPAGAQDHPEDLRAAVLLPTPEERRGAALALARRDGVTVDEWLSYCRAFGTFDPPPPGETVTRARLWTTEGVEETEIVVYVPLSYDPKRPAPLLLRMHWTGGSGRRDADDWTSIADQLGMLVLSPTETGENVGYTFSDRERASTLSALRWARLRFNVDENRIFATGVSRGGHLAWDLALRHPDLFAGIAPMIGGVRVQVAGGENNLRYLENVVNLPIRDLQGVHDDEVLVFDLRLAFERLERWNAPNARLIEFDDLGHWYRFDAVDWPAFWGSCVRDPRRERVVRAYARPGEGRAFWLEVLEADDEVQEIFVPSASKSLWESLDEFERIRYVQRKADERTGRLEGVLTRSRIKLQADHVTRARVLLDDEMLPAREAVVTLGRAITRRKVERGAEVLLLEFVERFDRTFLPVMEVVVP